MSFDRHEILKKHYRQEFEGWDWDAVDREFDRNSQDPDCCSEPDCGQRIVSIFIGSILSLTPSGKIYAFWTTNQTRADETRDAAWWEALEEVCEEHHCFTHGSDGDGDSVFIGRWMDIPEEVEEIEE